MPELPEPMTSLLEALRHLPGVGRRSAERIAFHLLKGPKAEALALARAIERASGLSPCPECYQLSEGGPCGICRDPARDPAVLCVVETPMDLLAIEKSGEFRGRYHVLGGRIAPLDGVGPEALTIGPLLRRVREQKVSEVILATNPDPDGDGTAMFLAHVLEPTGAKLTRLARGISSGALIEQANRGVLSDALRARRAV